MFIYDLFHTVLELPFLGLYPMVFCLYVLASGTCFKMLLYACGGKKNVFPKRWMGFIPKTINVVGPYFYQMF